MIIFYLGKLEVIFNDREIALYSTKYKPTRNLADRRFAREKNTFFRHAQLKSTSDRSCTFIKKDFQMEQHLINNIFESFRIL